MVSRFARDADEEEEKRGGYGRMCISESTEIKNVLQQNRALFYENRWC